MKIEQAIIDIGMKQKIKIAQLWKPANACYENPEIGIEIKHATVKHVIKDCALMAKSYIPIEVFCKIENPITNLCGKVKDIELKEFATEVADGKNVNKRVLYSMIFDYKKLPDAPKVKPKEIEDVYGDYAQLTARTSMNGAAKSYNYTEVISVLEALLL